MTAGNIVIAFCMFQVSDDKNFKDGDNYIGLPMATVIAIKSNQEPNKPPRDPRPCHAHLRGSVSMPTFSHGILHTFLRHESTCHNHVCL